MRSHALSPALARLMQLLAQFQHTWPPASEGALARELLGSLDQFLQRLSVQSSQLRHQQQRLDALTQSLMGVRSELQRLSVGALPPDEAA